MRTFFLSMAGAFAAMILFVIAGFVMLAFLIAGAVSSQPARPDNVVLSMDLNAGLQDQTPAGGFAAFIVGWIAFFYIWVFLLGWPVGPGAPTLYPAPVPA